METLNAYQSALVVPCYNEYARLSVDSFVDHLKLHPGHFICFVNDGSTDETLQLLSTIQAECKNAHVLNLSQNGGKAKAVYEGVQFALKNVPAEFYGYMDADLATPLSFISIMETELKKNKTLQLIFGSRQLADKSSIERKAFRHYSGRLVSRIITWSLGEKYGDTQCGAKLLTKSGAETGFTTSFQSSWVFDVELIKRILLKSGKDRIAEIPVNQWKDVGNSKVSPFYFFKMMGELMRIKRMK